MICWMELGADSRLLGEEEVQEGGLGYVCGQDISNSLRKTPQEEQRLRYKSYFR
jgi:hypothetical protein